MRPPATDRADTTAPRYPALPLSATPAQGLDKEEALFRLLEGHWRYLRNETVVTPVEASDRNAHAQGQYPFAAILGCADSRVSPELIFDQRQGDLFVVRVAGNIVGDGELASIEYAVEHLGVRLVVVLGHEQCGAVKAATENADLEGPIGYLVRQIAPAVERARSLPGVLLDNAVDENIRRSVHRLTEGSRSIAHRVDCGDVRILGARYALQSGDAEILLTLG